jgi:DNA repair exonuclease SbcCD ATPase subunit
MRIKNFMGIELADIKFGKGEVTLLTGPNGSGKTSALTAFWTAIGGGKMKPKKPIRDGEDTGSIEVDLQTENVKIGRLTVTRRFWYKRDKETKKITEEVTGEIKITGDNNQQFNKPQAILDELFTELSIDPTKFDVMTPNARRELLLNVIDMDIDLEEWGRVDAGLRDQRKEARSKAQTLRSQLEGMTRHDDAPEAVIDPADIQAKIDEAEKLELEVDGLMTEQKRLQDEATSHQQAVKEAEAEIKRLKSVIKDGNAKSVSLIEQGNELFKQAEAITVPDIEPLKAELLGVSDQNRKFDDNLRYRNARVAVEEANAAYERLEGQVKDHEKAKADAFSKAKMPVDGLKVDDKDITFKDIPWDQINSAERIHLALELQAALNPKLRFISCQYGSLVDADGRKAIAEFTAKNNFEVLMESVTGDEASIVFSDGRVVEPVAEEPAAEPVQKTLLPEDSE